MPVVHPVKKSRTIRTVLSLPLIHLKPLLGDDGRLGGDEISKGLAPLAPDFQVDGRDSLVG
jgi:hypothetical protein